MYSIVYTKKAANDIPNLKAAKLEKKTKALIELIRENPYQTPPPYKSCKVPIPGVSILNIVLYMRFWKKNRPLK